MVSPKPSISPAAIKHVSADNESSTPTSESVNPSTSESEEKIAFKRKRTLEIIPELLPTTHSPIYPSRLGRKRNQEKLKSIAENISQNLLKEEIMPLENLANLREKAGLYDELMQQLKDKNTRLGLIKLNY